MSRPESSVRFFQHFLITNNNKRHKNIIVRAQNISEVNDSPTVIRTYVYDINIVIEFNTNTK